MVGGPMKLVLVSARFYREGNGPEALSSQEATEPRMAKPDVRICPPAGRLLPAVASQGWDARLTAEMGLGPGPVSFQSITELAPASPRCRVSSLPAVFKIQQGVHCVSASLGESTCHWPLGRRTRCWGTGTRGKLTLMPFFFFNFSRNADVLLVLSYFIKK